MPELPEVETTLRGIEPWLCDAVIREVVVREPRLRWPVPPEVRGAAGQAVRSLQRRGKYILINLERGSLLLHLGMSGSLRVLTEASPPGKHDHFDIELVSPHVTPVHCCDGPRARLDGLSLGRSARHSVDYDCALLGRESQPRRTPEPSRYENWRNMRARCTIRYNDPRRFGTLLWLEPPTGHHPLLASLGPEPLSGTFDGDYLYARSRGRKLAVKSFVMDGRVVVGVGNIYASEALYMAGIHPLRAAGRVSLARYRGLAESISDVLQRAIRQGGTTLRDFSGAGGLPGYFAQDLLVYARAGQPCFQCAGEIRQKVIGQRASYYCAVCQR